MRKSIGILARRFQHPDRRHPHLQTASSRHGTYALDAANLGRRFLGTLLWQTIARRCSGLRRALAPQDGGPSRRRGHCSTLRGGFWRNRGLCLSNLIRVVDEMVGYILPEPAPVTIAVRPARDNAIQPLPLAETQRRRIL